MGEEFGVMEKERSYEKRICKKYRKGKWLQERGKVKGLGLWEGAKDELWEKGKGRWKGAIKVEREGRLREGLIKELDLDCMKKRKRDGYKREYGWVCKKKEKRVKLARVESGGKSSKGGE
ncbi:hypothetical protein ACH5RR_029255 [Cinchona calisaya]|uniref:Uncharacterized protein n=1 Tax=Cinchona calisaya TaxID=153742 RepID=A0ABD2YST1_9GENT